MEEVARDGHLLAEHRSARTFAGLAPEILGRRDSLGGKTAATVPSVVVFGDRQRETVEVEEVIGDGDGRSRLHSGAHN